MAFPQGIDFRSTAGYVTDPTNYDPEVDIGGGVSYPHTTVQGNTVGWEVVPSAISYRNRNSGNDPRIAGGNFPSGASDTVKYRIDLASTGPHNIGGAWGDANYAAGSAVDLYDTNTSLGSLCTGTTSAAQRFKDATNTEYTNVTWPTSQTLVSKTFSSTICRFVSVPDGVNNIMFASVYVESGTAVDKPSFRPNKLRPRIFAPGLAR